MKHHCPHTPCLLVGCKSGKKLRAISELKPELGSCVKVEVAVLVPNKPDGFCGRKATLKKKSSGAVKVEVAILSPAPSLIVRVVSVDVKRINAMLNR